MASIPKQCYVTSLTPVPSTRRRRIQPRVSFSPQNTVTAPLESEACPERPQSAPMTSQYYPNSPLQVKEVDEGILEFADFQCYDIDKNEFQNVPSEYTEQFTDMLLRAFGVTEWLDSGPYLFLYSDKDFPAGVGQLPFKIAGKLAIWVLLGEDDDIIDFGLDGQGEDLVLKEGLLDQLSIDEIISFDLLKELAFLYFPDAIALSQIDNYLFVELEETDVDMYERKVEKLPSGFINHAVRVKYMNGPLADPQHNRKKPNPKILNSEYDNTDYVKEDGLLRPGAQLIGSDGEVTAGTFVEKDGQQTLTCAFHAWQSQDTEKLGDPAHFEVKQSQSRIGYVSNQLANSDIGLATIDPDLKSTITLMDLGVQAKKLLSWRKPEVRRGDIFWFDSFVTGKQPLASLGVRHMVGRRRSPNMNNPPTEGYMHELNQGIFATGDRVIRSVPQVREGVCGSVLILAKKRGDTCDTMATRAKEGAVGGLIQWSDIRSKWGDANKLLVLCEVPDVLLDEGWQVANVDAEELEEVISADKNEF